MLTVANSGDLKYRRKNGGQCQITKAHGLNNETIIKLSNNRPLILHNKSQPLVPSIEWRHATTSTPSRNR